MKSLPGLTLCVGLAVAAKLLAETALVKDTLHFGALLLVILLGMGVRSLFHLPEPLKDGISFAQKPVLRFAVALLGFRLTLQKLAELGVGALSVVILATFAALWFGWWLARRFGLDEDLGLLLGVGGAICGASAVVAADSVVQSKKSQAALSLGIITLLGTVGILVYPWLGRILNMDPQLYALWNGASLHEMAQVVAAGDAFQVSGVTEASTVSKLARICLLAPCVLYLGFMLRSRGVAAKGKVPLVPWFLVAFVAFVGVASTGLVPETTLKAINEANTWIMAVGMAGVGLMSGFKDLKAAGWKPILVGTVQWVFLAALSYGLARLLTG